jgi:predicted DNA-binding protein (MmcQ/YjbR family)
MDRQGIFDYIRKKYEVLPEYPWRRYDDNAVFRHTDNKKLFALLMNVQKNRMGLSGEEYVDVINLKMDDIFFRDQIIHEDGILPAYHMNKLHWISVLLPDAPDDLVAFLVTVSFEMTKTKGKRKKDGE